MCWSLNLIPTRYSPERNNQDIKHFAICYKNVEFNLINLMFSIELIDFHRFSCNQPSSELSLSPKRVIWVEVVKWFILNEKARVLKIDQVCDARDHSKRGPLIVTQRRLHELKDQKEVWLRKINIETFCPSRVRDRSRDH